VSLARRPIDHGQQHGGGGLFRECLPDHHPHRGRDDERDQVVGPLNFTIGDAETAAAALSLTVDRRHQSRSSSRSPVRRGGSNRTVTITPATNHFGSRNDYDFRGRRTGDATDSFVLTFTQVNHPPGVNAIRIAPFTPA